MSEVYLAEHIHIGRREALKVLRPELARDPRFVSRFRREARAANRVQHPNIIAIYDFGELEDGRLYLSMEYAEGPSVERLLTDRGAPPVARGLDILRQLAIALAAAHRCGVVHRDLKPENLILVERRGQHEALKVLDFGMAKILGADDQELTRRGEILGTPAYMAPEQLLATELDPRSDVYALGCIAYELLTGKPPFSGSRVELAQAHLDREPEPPSQRAPGIPRPFDDVVLRCLSKRPEDRYDAPELIAALDRLVPLFGQQHTLRQHQQPAAPRVAPKRPWTPVPIAPAAAEADTAAASTGDVRGEVHRALREVAVELGRLGHGDARIDAVLDRTRALEAEAVRLARTRSDIETRQAAVEQRGREREGTLRFAIADLSFDARHADEVPADIEFQIETLSRRLDEVLAECRTELDEITDESIALAASEAEASEQAERAHVDLLEAVRARVGRLEPSPALAPLMARFQSIKSALADLA